MPDEAQRPEATPQSDVASVRAPQPVRAVPQSPVTSIALTQPLDYDHEFRHFALLVLVTLGLYLPYWGWKQWSLVSRLEQRQLSAGLRGFFLNFTSFSLFPTILKLAQSRASYQGTYNGTVLAAVLLITNFVSNRLDSGNDNILSFFIYAAIITAIQVFIVRPVVQAQVHLLNHDPAAREIYAGLKTNYALIAVLMLLVVGLFIAGLYAGSRTPGTV